MNLAKLGGSPAAVSASTAPDTATLTTEKVARVSWLDKQTNRRQVLVMAVGTPQSLGGLEITVKKCLPDYRGTLGQDVAWLEVDEAAAGNGRTAPWFAGWMLNTYPEVSTLDHPRYDMQLLGCGAKARQIAPKAAPVIVEDAGPAADTETPTDTPTNVEDKDNGNDPFVVPGIEEKNAPAKPAEPTPVADGGEVIRDGGAPVVEAKPSAVVAEPNPASAPAEVRPEPQAAPVENTAPQAGAAKPADELHKLMDGGVY